MDRDLAGRIVVALLLATLAAGAVVGVVWGRTLIDEGVFVNAARLVLAGELPYRDFPFSQGPALPYALAAATGPFGSSILAGRILGALGLVAVALAGARFAWSYGGAWSAALWLALLAIDLPALSIATTVRTQSLALPLVIAALLALSTRWRGPAGLAVAPSLLLWATGLRLTHGLAFAVVALWTAWGVRRVPGALVRLALLLAAQAALLFAPIVLAPRGFLFHVFSIQLSRSERAGFRYEGWWSSLVGKLAFLSDPATHTLPVLGLAGVLVALLACRIARAARPRLALPLADPLSASVAALALAGLVYAPHLVFEHGHYEYFVTTSVLLSLAIAVGVVAVGALGRGARAGMATAVALAIGFGVLGVVRHWDVWVRFGRGSFPEFRAEAQRIGRRAGAPDCTMATFQTHLAVESGCRVLPGLEYSLFSFQADMDSREAARAGVLNAERFERALERLRPELLAVTRQYAPLLAGPGKAPQRRAGDAGLLDAIEIVREEYAPHGGLWIATGRHIPGFLPAERVVLFARRDRGSQGPPGAQRQLRQRDGPRLPPGDAARASAARPAGRRR